jgi:hypothetical protein
MGQDSCSRNVHAQHCLVNEPSYLVNDASSHNVLQDRLLDRPDYCTGMRALKAVFGLSYFVAAQSYGSTIQDLVPVAFGSTVQLYGITYADTNSNGRQDPAEPIYPYARVGCENVHMIQLCTPVACSTE